MYALVCDDVPPVIASVLKSRVLAPKAPEPVATQPSAAAVNVWSPVSSLPVSACQLPASPVPVHPRKRAGRGKNPFLFAMLFEKNIEIFSDPNPSVLCVFSICLPPFRAWTSGTGREAGSWHRDEIRNIIGEGTVAILDGWSGVLRRNPGGSIDLSQGGYHGFGTFSLDSSRVVPTGPENVPVHVLQPVIIYLGNHL